MRESYTIQIFKKKICAAVKIAFNEEPSKPVIMPIKQFGISGQWCKLFSHLFVFMLFSHLGNVCTCESNATAELFPGSRTPLKIISDHR